MTEKVTQGKMMAALDWAYEMAVDGVPGLDTAEELAGSYTKNDWSKLDQVNSLIRWQNAKAGTSGFLAGLGGIITLPVALPANITSVLFIQIRMVAAIAVIGGYDVKDDQVKSLVYMCLAGNSAKDIAKSAGIAFGTKFSKSAINSISGKTLTLINQRVGFRLVTKFGETGVVNLGKMIPLAGGVIGGTFDSVTTNTVGNVARNNFIIE
jgi:uncharacterized protein (DUF697 family)